MKAQIYTKIRARLVKVATELTPYKTKPLLFDRLKNSRISMLKLRVRFLIKEIKEFMVLMTREMES